METNLKKIITEQIEISEDQRRELAFFLGYRCRQKTVLRLVSICTYSLYSIPVYGILERVQLDDNGWSYCAGQSYPDEMRTVRNIVLNR